MIVSDNLKSGIIKVCFYEPNANRKYQEMADYYDSAIVPARPKKPKPTRQAIARWWNSLIRTGWRLRKISPRKPVQDCEEIAQNHSSTYRESRDKRTRI
jgi:hypothetical protein